MNLQGIGQQRQCSSGRDLDLFGKLPLVVLIASFLDRFPREVIAVREQIWTEREREK